MDRPRGYHDVACDPSRANAIWPIKLNQAYQACHTIARNEHSCARRGGIGGHASAPRRAICSDAARATRHRVDSETRRSCRVELALWVNPATRTRILVPRNRVARCGGRTAARALGHNELNAHSTHYLAQRSPLQGGGMSQGILHHDANPQRDPTTK